MTPEERSRVEGMASGSLTWDLSPNDIAALKALLTELACVTAERDRLARADAERLTHIRNLVVKPHIAAVDTKDFITVLAKLSQTMTERDGLGNAVERVCRERDQIHRASMEAHQKRDAAQAQVEKLSARVSEACAIGNETVRERDAALKVLRGYEAWEAALLLTEASWSGALPRFTQELWDSWMELQAQRNAALAATEPKR